MNQITDTPGQEPEGEADTPGQAPGIDGSSGAGSGGTAARRRIWRVFSSDVHAPRLRRPTDVALLALSIAIILALALVAPGPTEVDNSITTFLVDLSGPIGWIWSISYALLSLWAVVLVLLVVFAKGRRRLLLDFLLATVLALALAGLASVAAGTSVADGVRALFSPGPPPVYLAIRLALVTAIVVTASPHLTRPLRNVARGLITVGAFATIALGISFPIGVLAGFFVGVGAGALTHLFLGSPGGHPTADQVVADLQQVGVNVRDLSASTKRISGVALFNAIDDQGRQLFIKVYARDAWDDQWITASWRSLLQRSETASSTSSRLHRVEHEALATLIAERAGVAVLPVVAVGETDDDAVLATESRGTAFNDLPITDLTDELLESSWTALRSLHEQGISHGQIDGQRLIRDADGSTVLADFGAATMSAPDLAKLCDDARLLVTTALLVGHKRAVSAAYTVIGADGLAALLPYLQPAVLSRSTRKAVKDGKWSLKDLTALTVSTAGVEAPKLEKLRRVTPKSIAVTVLLVVLSYLVITKIAGADLSAIVEAFESANYWWLLGALIVTPFAQVAYSFGTLGASIVPLRYLPVLMLQYAIQFIAVVLPATAARLALEVRFFQRFGIPAGAALSIGAVDSGAGFVVQVLLLVLIGASSLPGLTAPVNASSSSTTEAASTGASPVLMLAIGLIVAGLLAFAVVPSLRRRVTDRIPKIREQVREQWRAVRETLAVLRKPRKVALMLVGNLGAQVIQAITLGLCLMAFGETAYLSQLILINTLVSLFAGLMPVPGGVGVAEAGYIAGLQACGIPSAIAISTALLFRVLTFYLPPLWGGFAMRWLRKNSYV